MIGKKAHNIQTSKQKKNSIDIETTINTTIYKLKRFKYGTTYIVH